MRITDDEDGFVVEPGPGLVAHISIVVARAGDDRVIDRMDAEMRSIEHRAQTVEDLAFTVARYASDAIRAIGDPGYGNVSGSLYAALRTGVEYEDARRGAFYDPDVA